MEKQEYSLSGLAEIWSKFFHHYIVPEEILISTSKGKKISRKSQEQVGHYVRLIRDMAANRELTLVVDYDDLSKAVMDNASYQPIIDCLETEVDMAIESGRDALVDIMKGIGAGPDNGETESRLGAQYAADMADDIKLSIINPSRHLNIPEIKNHHLLLKLVSFEGIVNATDEDTRFMFIKAAMQCPSCNRILEYQGSPNPNRVHKCDDCKVNLKLNIKESVGQSYQSIRVQERPDNALEGRVATDIEVRITNQEYINLVRNGDFVNVSGIVRIDHERSSRSPIYDFYIDASHIELKHEDFMAEYDPVLAEQVQSAVAKETEDTDFEKLWHSVAPTVTGHKAIKIAILLLMAGGLGRDLPDRSRLRGDINLLFVGDSETFKTVFARWLAPVMPRFVYNSGESSSIAGLMATALYNKEGIPVLTGGAFVLANSGVIVLDEIDKYDDNQRQRLLEVLEDTQTMTIRKLGINKTLHVRCSTIGIANPIAGYWDKNLSFEENTGFKRAWYSRFDLIFTFIDQPDREKDTQNAEHFMDHYFAGTSEKKGAESRKRQHLQKTKHIKVKTKGGEVEYYSPAFMAHWVRHVRQTYEDPVLLQGSKAHLSLLTSYLKARGYDVEHMSREDIERTVKARKIGPRQIGALIRLARASARAHMRNEVTEKDAKLAIWLIKESIRSSGLHIVPGDLDSEDTITTAPVSTLKTNDISIPQKELDRIAKAEHGPRSRFLKVLGKVGTTECSLCRRGRTHEGQICDNCTKGVVGTIFSKSTFFAECDAVDIDIRYVKHYWDYCQATGYVKFKGRGDTHELTSAGFVFLARSIAYKELPSLEQEIEVEKENDKMSRIRAEMAKVKIDPTDKLLQQDLETDEDEVPDVDNADDSSEADEQDEP